MEKEKLCLRCMRKIGDSNFCPYCRNENSEPQKAPYLPLKTVVGGKYLVGKLVETNSEGSTYYAFDYERKTPVTLRELFPKGVLSRGEGNYCLVNVGKVSEFVDIKDEFKNLWKGIAETEGFNALTPVYDVIEDLGTVYVVSEYLGEGKILREYLLENEQGYISWDEARALFMPVLSALGELHSKGIVHGGISPTTLVMDKNGKLRITGYSISAVRRQKSNMESEIFDGYAAVEQYGFSGELTPCTDIYAFAAVLYRALIGSTPMSAASRLTNDKLMIPGKFAEQLPAYVINALVNALQILPEDRTQNAEQLRDEVSASPVAAGTAAEVYSSMYASHEEEGEDAEVTLEDALADDAEEESASPDKGKLKKSTVVAFAVSVVICLAILVVALVGFNGFSNDSDDETTTEATTSEETTDEITESGVISINIPNFRGKLYEDVKNDETYKQVLIFNTEYIDSSEDRGVIVKQDVPAGTMVSSLNPRVIVIGVSNGLEVPDVVGSSMRDAVKELKAAGFKNVEAVVGNIADSADESQMVYSVVYEDPETGNWAALPDDRHLSASDKVLVYYHGEFEEETQTPQTEGTEETTEEPTQAEPVDGDAEITEAQE